MRFVDEYRAPEQVMQLIEHLRERAALLPYTAERPLRIMEVCGGHTHAIFKFGLDQLLPENVEFIHGPGCPVCVLPMTRSTRYKICLMLSRTSAHCCMVRRDNAFC